ncbi:N-acetylneuraminate synthase family protein [[Clostridium] innocuum]|uniref:N-acetylneuraminate synthase family protein n=1 Tax=Clostridium innocuum TaxID=1522 RepID=UPI001EDD9724|nr:N-acetylneuraminate synthase family protein [[Clostridium] innocuum]MCG4662744.1 N-acetylneuraminate synthase family protein [[Clostridium] innocuum]MCR0332735.1 N-acetylneuraminate synthase family protein [[Clostridium] innocuum]
MATIKFLNDRVIGDYKTPYIIAELGANHNGDMNLAREMIMQAKKAGCDCVKFQSWSKDSVFSKKVYEDNYFLADDYRNRDDYTLKEIVDEFSISENELIEMKALCDDIGIDCTSTPFSKREVDVLTDIMKVPFIKIASMDLNNYPFLEYIAKKNVPVVLSTGLSELSEIDMAIRTIEATGNKNIVILHCISIYPPEMEDINLNNILSLRRNYPEYPIGFSDHSIGAAIPLAAIALGSCIIEKHFTLDKNMFGWDHKVSADFDEIKMIVSEGKNINKALGSTRKIVSPQELKKREAFRRSLVAAKNIQKGSIITLEDIDFKRPGTGLSPEMIDIVIGRKAKRDIKYDEMILKSDF